MTRKVLCVSPERTVDECMALCTSQRARHLPVVDQKQVVGIVSIGDLVKAVIAEQQHLIEELQHYISGGGAAGPAAATRFTTWRTAPTCTRSACVSG